MRNGYHGDHTQSAQNSVVQEKKLELGNVTHQSMEENLVLSCLNVLLIVLYTCHYSPSSFRNKCV